MEKGKDEVRVIMKNKRIFLLTHALEGKVGSLDLFGRWLQERGWQVFKLANPLDEYQGKNTIFSINSKTQFRILRKRGRICNWLYDGYISLRTLLKTDFDIFVGASNFDVFWGILAKYLFGKKIQTIVFFAPDFSEARFKNFILDQIYYLLERIALKFATVVISKTVRAEQKRLHLGMGKEKSLVVPNGVRLYRPVFLRKEIQKDHFVFVGSVTPEHGLDEFLKVMYPLVKKLVVIGAGGDLNRIKNFCRHQKINVQFLTNRSHRFIINYLQKFGGFGLAPYNLKARWTYYCSPLKVAEYIACGVPVIMSAIPEIAGLVRSKGYGIVYQQLDYQWLKKAIDSFATKNYHQKAREFFTQFNSDILFSRILRRIINVSQKHQGKN